MKLLEMHVIRSLILMDCLGPEILMVTSFTETCLLFENHGGSFTEFILFDTKSFCSDVLADSTDYSVTKIKNEDR